MTTKMSRKSWICTIALASVVLVSQTTKSHAIKLQQCMDDQTPETGISLCTEIIESNTISKDKAKAFLKRGGFRSLKRDWGGALSDALNYLKLDPKGDANWIAYNNACWSAYRLNRYADAESYCSNALKIKPDFQQALSGRGFSRIGLRKLQEAEDDFNEILLKHQDYGPAYKGLGHVFDQKNDRDRAIVNFKRASELNAPNDSKYKERLAYLEESRKAAHGSEASIDNNPGKVVSPTMLGTFSRKLNESDNIPNQATIPQAQRQANTYNGGRRIIEDRTTCVEISVTPNPAIQRIKNKCADTIYVFLENKYGLETVRLTGFDTAEKTMHPVLRYRACKGVDSTACG